MELRNLAKYICSKFKKEEKMGKKLSNLRNVFSNFTKNWKLRANDKTNINKMYWIKLFHFSTIKDIYSLWN